MPSGSTLRSAASCRPRDCGRIRSARRDRRGRRRFRARRARAAGCRVARPWTKPLPVDVVDVTARAGAYEPGRRRRRARRSVPARRARGGAPAGASGRERRRPASSWTTIQSGKRHTPIPGRCSPGRGLVGRRREQAAPSTPVSDRDLPRQARVDDLLEPIDVAATCSRPPTIPDCRGRSISGAGSPRPDHLAARGPVRRAAGSRGAPFMPALTSAAGLGRGGTG